MPSTVVRSAPLAWAANIVQALTDIPFISMVQAPQWEVSQPICGPVMFEIFPQEVDQKRARLDEALHLLAVDGHGDRDLFNIAHS
jgi:hypothetical protein